MHISEKLENFPSSSVAKESTCNSGDLSLIPGSGRFPGVGNGNPLQYSCLENSMDRGAWQAIIHGVTKIQTRLSTHTNIHIKATLVRLGTIDFIDLMYQLSYFYSKYIIVNMF